MLIQFLKPMQVKMEKCPAYMKIQLKRIILLMAFLALTACGGGTNSIISDLPSRVMQNSYLVIVTSVVVVDN